MNYDLIIHGGNVVTPDGTSKADITIADGKIQSIGQTASMPSAKRAIDATGRYVMVGVFFVVAPGVVAKDGVDLQQPDQKDQPGP